METPRYDLGLEEALKDLEEEAYSEKIATPDLTDIPPSAVYQLGYQKAVQDLRLITSPAPTETGIEMLVADEPLMPDYAEPEPITDPIPEPEDG